MDPVRKLADAVLYEGYILWPYRRSALKNSQRWTIGGVFPRAWSEAHPDDRARLTSEVLLWGDPGELDVRVRFLHVVRRQAFEGGTAVDEVERSGERLLSWEEAVERELRPGRVAVAAGEEREELGGGAALVRSWRELAGTVALAASELRPGLWRIRLEVANDTPFAGADRAAALAQAFCSTHAVLRAGRGEFVSLTDPPADLRAEAEACRNEGVWPVLVEDRHTLLVSPIILEDFPRIAPESPGDLFDGGEIDGLLTLSILSLTDAEKAEMRATDPRAREILERTEGLSEEELLRLHGAVRELQVRR